MKKVYYKIVSVLLISTVFLFAFLTYSTVKSGIARNEQYLTDVLEDLERKIERASEAEEGEEDEIIQRLLVYTPTEGRTTLLAVSKEKGTWIGVTGNNRERFSVNGMSEERALLSLFQKSCGGEKQFVKIDGAINLMIVREWNNVYLAGFQNMDLLFPEIIGRMKGILLFFVITSAAMIGIFYMLMKKYVFDDLVIVDTEIKHLLDEEYVSPGKTCTIPEMQKVIETIGGMKQGYMNKTERMNKIFSSISPNIGVFECLEAEKGNFFSENLWRILDMGEKSQAYYMENAKDFVELVNEMMELKNVDDIISYRDKYLEIHTYQIGKENIGVIIDRTREESSRLRLKKNLESARKKQGTDEMTGLMNRSGFREQVMKHIVEQQEGTLIIFDLDNFKTINDTFGHPEGDRVICLFADCLREEFRKSDVTGRLGGDEFVAFLPGVISEEELEEKLEKTLQRARKKLRSYEAYSVSVSAGAGRIDLNRGISSYQALYESADAALYIAKKLGKNRFYINREE